MCGRFKLHHPPRFKYLYDTYAGKVEKMHNERSIEKHILANGISRSLIVDGYARNVAKISP